MSIMILRGPDADPAHPRPPLAQAIPADLVAALVDRAASAGHALAIRTCASDADVVQALDAVDSENVRILLFDPGASVRNGAVVAAVRRLGTPYIEVHDDDYPATEPELDAVAGHRIRVVHGYRAQSYMLAMSMALEHIGCAECELDVHVGT